MIQTLWRIATSAAEGYFTNRLSTSAAAMAFYTMFAIGPIMIFSIAIAEPFVGKLMAQEAVFKALETVVAPEQLKGIQRFASQDLFRGGGIAALIGAGVLLYTGTRVFVELQSLGHEGLVLPKRTCGAERAPPRTPDLDERESSGRGGSCYVMRADNGPAWFSRPWRGGHGRRG